MKTKFLLSMTLSTLIFWALGCGGGGGATTGTPTTPTGTTGGNVGATVTLTASGVSDAAPRIATGDRVRFTNNDTSTHHIFTTPHGPHSDCPALNSIGSLAPGQSGVSEPLTTARGCGFHDHMNPSDNRFRGQVLVGLSAGDPPPPDPGY